MSGGTERVGVLLVNFGEPATPGPREVESFLERIFLQNAGLEPDEPALTRARQLARDRSPGLLEEYRRIGGSPLNAQADAQAAALESVLRAGGLQVRTYSAYQFTEPSIEDRLHQLRRDGTDLLVVLPVYPLCGRSTTVAALDTVRLSLATMAWSPRAVAIAGWHDHPAYVAFRAEHLGRFLEERDLDPSVPGTLIYFSAHGTPIRYLDEGNRYDRYVEEHCRAIAERVGAPRYAVGFQNHGNRSIPWTQPDNQARIRAADEVRLVVVPISFMHEQSETLSELDRDLRVFAESLGKQFHRVPVPHDDPEFVDFLADLVRGLVSGQSAGNSSLTPCRCAGASGVLCTNGDRDLPPSPYLGDRGTP